MTDVPIGRQRYDSGQMKVTRRFSQGLAMTVAYTVAKTLEQVTALNAQSIDIRCARSWKNASLNLTCRGNSP